MKPTTGIKVSLNRISWELLNTEKKSGLYTGETYVEGFWRNVAKSAPDNCWEWVGKRFNNGYGCYYMAGIYHLAHRVSYFIVSERLPKQVNHTCHNKSCVNPAHLVGGNAYTNFHATLESGNWRYKGKEGTRWKKTWRKMFRDFDKYQEAALTTASYPQEAAILYPSLALAEECGEVCKLIAKSIRDGNSIDTEKMKSELGDCLWEIAALAAAFGISLTDVARRNLEKLQERAKRDVIHGDGDNR